MIYDHASISCGGTSGSSGSFVLFLLVMPTFSRTFQVAFSALFNLLRSIPSPKCLNLKGLLS
jgi:hypothetical protein